MKTINYFLKVVLLIFLTLIASKVYAKEVCITNIGKDPIAIILSHSMQWVETRRGRCVNTDDTSALIQNSDVKDVCSFDEKTTKVDLINYACFRVVGKSGTCEAKIESWEFAEDCEKRVKKEDIK